ncbi:hypothetical protein CLV32_1790 [Pedobacter duraquae]|uniref:Uncharacterized protein n=1 Tax=Pedobacter duraquae TaxID=425511 RepID=A0A4R6ILI4_9SPHI|nr:hypothetical protein CLV32_1790 [Pedobacter duraquae]
MPFKRRIYRVSLTLKRTFVLYVLTAPHVAFYEEKNKLFTHSIIFNYFPVT